MSAPTSVPTDIDTFLPETYALPSDTKEYPLYFKDKLEDITRSLNAKDIGAYFLFEQPIGQQYFGDSVDLVAQIKPNIGSDLVISRTPGM